jgi:UDP-N-acetylglucosamine enolpyruvyl transferase
VGSITDPLTLRLATTATGYGAVINGVLDVRTVADTPNSAAMCAIMAQGRRVLSNCADPDCDCKLRLLADMFPEVKIVPVSVEATDG